MASQWQKKFNHMFSRFDTIPACDGQTDILRQHSLLYAWHHVVIWLENHKIVKLKFQFSSINSVSC